MLPVTKRRLGTGFSDRTSGEPSSTTRLASRSRQVHFQMIELDLHQYTVPEALERIVQQYNAVVAWSAAPQAIVLIHGFKQGTALRDAIRDFLRRKGIPFGAASIEAESASAPRLRRQSARVLRHEIFRAIRNWQTRGQAEHEAIAKVALRYRMSVEQVQRIEADEAIEERRAAFRKIFALKQDGYSEHIALREIARKYQMPLEEIRQIQREGVKNRWPTSQ